MPEVGGQVRVQRGIRWDMAATNGVPPQLYIGDCPSVSEVIVRESEDQGRVSEKSEKHIREGCQR